MRETIYDMGKLKTQSLANKNNGMLKLKVVVEKLQKRLSEAKKWAPRNTNLGTVPVKKGHFAVIAVDDYEEKKFVVPLAHLERPSFQKLLERAAEEYGFNHEGALMVPCRPSEFEWILDGSGDDVGRSSSKAMVESC
ncbi:auxin-responsive protein SAUR24 [Lactuca sativa]|uniref:auxin-responsive protein SAUR24 n=1 Tax=Lactuca sativa TaxID=4236 RepID=UPI000CD80954|nr:auxin-responsive protein SAUR24 [Lactuca sativa]